MSMTLLDRVILVAVGLFLVCFAALAAAAGFGWLGGAFRAFVTGIGAGPLEAGVGALILILAGLHVVFFGLQRAADEGIRQETDLGHVQISLRAIENLARRSASQVAGVKEAAVDVHPSPEGVAFTISLIVAADAVIPEVSDRVGREVRDQVQKTVGVVVGDISVEIKNVSEGTSKGRVE